MRAIIKQIPNLFTLANLTCGVLAIISFFQALGYFNQPYPLPPFNPFIASLNQGIILIAFALVFDFLDGFSAKLLKAQSPIGAQLDSLADLITFGVAPSILVYVVFQTDLFINATPIIEVFDETQMYVERLPSNIESTLLAITLLIPVFSALRLAKFNVDTEQTDYFKGIPTPANAIFWCGIILTLSSGIRINAIIVGILIIVMSLLMVSNLKMIAFKFKDLSFKGDNVYRYLLIAGAILLTIICSLLGNIFAAIPLTIFFYILLSIPYHFYKTKNG